VNGSRGESLYHRRSLNVRKPLHGPFFFELFALANFLFIGLLLLPLTPAVFTTLQSSTLQLGGIFLAELATGIVVRLAVGWFDGSARAYLAVIRSPRWILDTARLILFAVVIAHTYGWIKLMVPLLHPRLFDRQLWNFETALFGGYSPTVLILSLFSNPRVIRFVDAMYGPVFVLSMNVAYSFIFSAPSRRLRVAFTDSSALLWLIGAWLYVAIPTLGPVYRFHDLFRPYAALMPDTQNVQRLLLENYELVISRARHVSRPVNILFGIAAFPSLHVAFEAFILLWVRKLWRYGTIVFGICTVLIFIGSVVTGWHYLIDSAAGIVLAVVCYAVVARARRIGRWLDLREAIAGGPEA
jgi:hypothetical protein